ncbi:MAG: hypothetical protein LQ338_001941 [Usnochroma carphineum]|nr:MAG: hypothetical protein LQ338_001941 [Usnochroma carphineum]
MHPSIIKHILAAATIFKGVAKLAAAAPAAAAAPTQYADLVPRHDYEPGDMLNRTMCFCTTDTSLQQTDNDPEVFYNTTFGHRMTYVYEFTYYNHRLGKTMQVTSRDEICPTEDSPDDPYYHNKCLAWEDQDRDFCADFVLHDLPAGVVEKNWWRFCYLFRGDELDDPSKRDFFSLDKAKRALPRKRDWIEPVEEVEERCGGLCEGRGMQLFRSRLWKRGYETEAAQTGSAAL